MWCSEFIASSNIGGVYLGIYLSTAKIEGKTIPTGFALYFAGKSQKRKSNILGFLKRHSRDIDFRLHCGGLINLRHTKIKFTKYNKCFTEFDYEQIKLERIGIKLVFKAEYSKLRNKKR